MPPQQVVQDVGTSRRATRAPTVTPQKPTLLTLPPEIRNLIWYHAMLAPQLVTKERPYPPVPGLIQTCRQTLRESLGFFIYSTPFTALVLSTDDAFMEDFFTYLASLESLLLQNIDNLPLPANWAPPRNVHYLVQETANWGNLLRWAKVMHRYPEMFNVKPQSWSSNARVMWAVVDTVMRLKNLPWGEVEPVLENVRAAAAAFDAQWR